MAAVQPVEFDSIAPVRKHTASVVLVHGLGQSKDELKPEAETFKTDPDLQHIKWIFPQAPTMSITLHNGMEMPAWYNVVKFAPGPDDEASMLRSVAQLRQLINAEINAGIPAERIVIGGFSQGAAMSLLTGLTHEQKLGGAISLSGRLPLQNKLTDIATDHGRSIPIFWAQGTTDEIVTVERATSSVEYLKTALGIPDAALDAPEKGGIDFHSYEGLGHSRCPRELDDLKNWLKRVLPAQE